MSYRIIDSFAGLGGWDTGLAWIGRDDVLGIEFDADAVATGRAAGHLRLDDDVSLVDPHEFGRGVVEGTIGSPPCQGFSSAGKGRGRGDIEAILKGVGELAAGRDPRAWLNERCADHRSALVLEPLRYALALRPEWIAWEQVPAVLPLWQACADVLRELGYSVWTGILNAEQYGVPQTRRRAILIASRCAAVTPPAATHSRYYPRTPGKLDDGVLPWVSMVQALGWADGTVFTGQQSRAAGATVTPQCRSTSSPAPTVTGNVKAWAMVSNYGTGGDPKLRGLRLATQPAPTVTSKINRNRWSDDRRVSVAETSLLQTFSATYPWRGARREEVWRQIGDAIPPLLAAHVLAALGVGALRLESAA